MQAPSRAMEPTTFTDQDGRAWPAALADLEPALSPVWNCVVTVGPGWAGLIDEARSALAAGAPGARLVACDRDREGGLMLEVAWGDLDPLDWMVKSVRSRSFIVCEQCGAGARLRHDRPQLSVLCDAHAGARDQMGVYRPELARRGLGRLLRRR